MVSFVADILHFVNLTMAGNIEESFLCRLMPNILRSLLEAQKSKISDRYVKSDFQRLAPTRSNNKRRL